MIEIFGLSILTNFFVKGQLMLHEEIPQFRAFLKTNAQYIIIIASVSAELNSPKT
jgi:hypothetical protein